MRVLVVVAHPDDEVLGCGGTMALLAHQGHEIYVLILGEGVTSRDEMRDPDRRVAEIAALRKAARQAAKILGVKEIFFEDFPDNRFDTVPLLELIKAVEQIKKRITPDMVFTHFEGDLNIDHRLTARAVMTATRPLPGEVVRRVYAFEVPSSTEWNFATAFRPNMYFEITPFLERKIEALRCYEEELRAFPHPRSVEGIKHLARMRGTESGCKAAEAFGLIRAVEPAVSDSTFEGEHFRLAKALLRRHEGMRLKPYRDTVGKLTIGYGRNLDDQGISEEEAAILLRNDLRRCEEELQEILGETYEKLSPARRAVLLDMIYNLGRSRFLSFRKFLAALKAGDFEQAAVEMLDSKWSRQVGRRAEELAKIMRRGEVDAA